MKYDFASIVRFIMNNVGTQESATLTFENKMDGFSFPVFYFPQPEEKVSRIALRKTYLTDSSLYLHIFSTSNESAISLANKVKTAFLQADGLIPICNDDGEITDDMLPTRVEEVRLLDDSVSEVYIRWKTPEIYDEMSAGTIDNFFIDINKGD